MTVGQKNRKRTSILDEVSVQVKNEVLLTTRLHNLEQEHDWRDNPLSRQGIIVVSKKITTTATNTDVVVDRDTQIALLLEETERLHSNKGRL